MTSQTRPKEKRRGSYNHREFSKTGMDNGVVESKKDMENIKGKFWVVYSKDISKTNMEGDAHVSGLDRGREEANVKT